MAVTFQCEHCGHTLRLSQKFAGQRGRCTQCQQEIVAPTDSSVARPQFTSGVLRQKFVSATLGAAIGAALLLTAISLFDRSENYSPISVAVEVAEPDTQKSEAIESSTPEVLQLAERIAAILPTREEDKWLEIDWRTDLLRARVEASEKNKPMFMWLMNGDPFGCT